MMSHFLYAAVCTLGLQVALFVVSDTHMMMKAADFEVGGPEKLFIGQKHLPVLRNKHVLIKVHATALNRADTLQRKGLYTPPDGESEILGLEAAGTVEKVDPGVSKWKVGDRVMALLPGGGYAEYVSAYEDHIMPVDKNLSFTMAAAIPEVWLTAYQLLHNAAALKSGETVLIHAGGSGVGTAAVQLVTLAGGIPLVTAGSEEKLDLAKSVGAQYGFNYKSDNFAEKVLEVTEGHGVDVILDCIGASFWEQNVEALAVDGRWILYGLMGGSSVDGDFLRRLFKKRASLISSALRSRSVRYKADLVSSFTTSALPHFATGLLKPIIHTVMDFSKVSEAHAMMENNTNAGKIVLALQNEEMRKTEL